MPVLKVSGKECREFIQWFRCEAQSRRAQCGTCGRPRGGPGCRGSGGVDAGDSHGGYGRVNRLGCVKFAVEGVEGEQERGAAGDAAQCRIDGSGLGCDDPDGIGGGRCGSDEGVAIGQEWIGFGVGRQRPSGAPGEHRRPGDGGGSGPGIAAPDHRGHTGAFGCRSGDVVHRVESVSGGAGSLDRGTG
jgi:hypothetical protein